MSIRSLLLAIFIFFGLFVVIVSFSPSMSFTEEGANKLRDQAIDYCLGEGAVSIEHVRYCSENNPLEKFQVGPLGYAAILLFVICPLLAVIWTLLVALMPDPFADKPLTKEQQSKLPKSQDRTLTVGPGRAKVDGTSLFQNEWDVHPVKYNLENVKDIIKRNHIAKGDYSDHFGRLVNFYLDPGPEGSGKSFVSQQEIISYLEWAIKTVPKVYAGSDKEAEAGKRKIKSLEKYIQRMKEL